MNPKPLTPASDASSLVQRQGNDLLCQRRRRWKGRYIRPSPFSDTRPIIRSIRGSIRGDIRDSIRGSVLIEDVRGDIRGVIRILRGCEGRHNNWGGEGSRSARV